ncbi:MULTISPECIES: hypothetical protein [Nocardiaceae]|uniref:Ribbon-helix-helix protein, copG family n=1 Tax=Rhodococcoides kroppenstedtii TaxID=293050 RepID=A0ABS7NVL8_9NOCA|nr:MULTISPECIES: hypothetical protein [Rhodococcus]AMY20077.1 hypothetical protein A3Q40_02710 [Rhodococcus sp. PBTS 1]MBY6314382.1 hypothetical protein [Rhodococcus kroppenstedtii]MBY6322078.1 hypothetical protein [Rhodococcus kroppenstedtii]MBY6400966.1 hypothetical protein [Rhodococcus kroppenstedtii]
MADPVREEDYGAMADDYATTPPTSDEVVAIDVNPAALAMGRPRDGAGKGRNTPAMSVRFPATMRADIHRRAQADDVPDADIVRRAVDEYLHRHPVT